MSTTYAEKTESQTLIDLLKDCSVKLAELNRDYLSILESGHPRRDDLNHLPKCAWLLDRAKRIDQPCRDLANLATAVLERSEGHADSLEQLAVSVRVGELEAHLHHMLRLTSELKVKLVGLKLMDQVAKLRESAGLNAMKGGPLRPND